MHITSILLSVILIMNILLAIVVVFLERKDASASWAWLLVLFFAPVLGFVMYLLLGQSLRRNQLFKWDSRNRTEIEKLVKNQVDELKNGDFIFRHSSTRDNQDLIFMHLKNNDALLTEDNTVRIFTDGYEKFKALLKDISHAKDHIHIQYYIVRNDNLGKQLIKELTRKAKEGVRVRFLYDELGSRGVRKSFFKELVAAGGEVEVFFPSKLPLINLRLNFRNHRKLVIIDGKQGYIGGFNVGDEYLGLSKKFGYWRDTHLKIKGNAVYGIQTRFILDWNQASRYKDIKYVPEHFPQIVSKGSVGIQIVSSGPDSEWQQIKNGYIKMISSAKKSILIQTPYFIPDASLYDAVQIACLSGIEVKIMIPNKPDHIFVYWATLSYVGELMKAGAKIYIYENGFIHAKTLVVDDEVSSVGTANIDVRSFKLNFEVNAFVYDEGISRKLADIFYSDIEKSRELTMEVYQRRSLWIRFKESIARLLTPIL